MEKNWYKNALYKVHLDMHCPEWHESIFENFNAEAIVSQVKQSGAKALYFFTKDCYGNAYYHTKVGHRHRCMGSRDFLSEILIAAAKKSLPIMAYATVIWDNFSAEAHPEWCMRDPEGKALTDTITMDVGKWRYVCHNTGYADFAVEMIKEIAGSYPIQGFHLDMFNLDFGKLSCYCDTCHKMFKEQTGKDLPVTPLWDETWRQFLEFRYRSVERLAQRMRQAALACNPDLCIVMNYHGSPNMDWRVGQMPVRHSLYSDLGTGETYTPMLGDMYPGLESRFIRCLVPGKPYEIVSWRMNRVTEFTVKPANQLRWELFATIVQDGSVMLIDQPFHDGTLDPVAYDRIQEVFKDIEDYVPYIKGDFVKHCAIYYSCKNRDLYGRDQQEKFIQPIMGAYKALVESHYDVEFLFDETITAERLAEYPIVLLANVATMDKHEVELFENYVKEGGCLIATYDTSRYSGVGEGLKNFQLNKIFGVDYDKTYDCDTYWIRNLPSPYGDDIDSRYHVLCQGKVHFVKKTTATGIGDLHDSFFKRIMPNQFFSHNIHPPYKVISEALYVNKFGKGTCVFMPHGLDRAYADTYELPEHRILLRNVVESLAVPPVVSVKAPLNVETVVRQTKDKIYVHFISYNPIRQAATLPRLDKPIRPSLRMEEAMIFRASIKVKRPFKSATAASSQTQIRIQGDTVNILCDRVHEAIVIE